MHQEVGLGLAGDLGAPSGVAFPKFLWYGLTLTSQRRVCSLLEDCVTWLD